MLEHIVVRKRYTIISALECLSRRLEPSNSCQGTVGERLIIRVLAFLIERAIRIGSLPAFKDTSLGEHRNYTPESQRRD